MEHMTGNSEYEKTYELIILAKQKRKGNKWESNVVSYGNELFEEYEQLGDRQREVDLRQTSFYRYQALKKKTEDSCGCKWNWK